MTARELFTKAKEQMRPEQIDNHYSDLYLKKTPISEALINEYEYKQHVTEFIDNIEHERWYEIPFANMDYWDEKFTSLS